MIPIKPLHLPDIVSYGEGFRVILEPAMNIGHHMFQKPEQVLQVRDRCTGTYKPTPALDQIPLHQFVQADANQTYSYNNDQLRNQQPHKRRKHDGHHHHHSSKKHRWKRS